MNYIFSAGCLVDELLNSWVSIGLSGVSIVVVVVQLYIFMQLYDIKSNLNRSRIALSIFRNSNSGCGSTTIKHSMCHGIKYGINSNVNCHLEQNKHYVLRKYCLLKEYELQEYCHWTGAAEISTSGGVAVLPGHTSW